MTKYSLLLAVLALGCLAVPAGAQPTVNNGDFETGADMFNTFPGYLGHFGGAGSYPAGDNPSEIPGWDSHSGGCGVVTCRSFRSRVHVYEHVTGDGTSPNAARQLPGR